MNKKQLLDEGFQNIRAQTESVPKESTQTESLHKDYFMNDTRVLEGLKPSLIEPFDGIRKNNARKIFGILLIIIVVDFAMELIV